MTVFWRLGYAGTSMRDLTQATGLSAAALYNRFADKDGLFVAVLRRYSEIALTPLLVDRLAASRSPVAAIRGFFDALIAASQADADRLGCLLVNTIVDGAAMSDDARAMLNSRFGELEAFFATQLRRAIAEGAIDPGIDPAAKAAALLGTAFGLRVLSRLRDDPPDQLRDLADNALAFLAEPPPALRLRAAR